MVALAKSVDHLLEDNGWVHQYKNFQDPSLMESMLLNKLLRKHENGLKIVRVLSYMLTLTLTIPTHTHEETEHACTSLLRIAYSNTDCSVYFSNFLTLILKNT